MLRGNTKAIISADSYKGDKFQRLKRISWISFESIERTRVLVVGAGALGNEVSKNLILSGFRDITIVDMDTIEPSNLSRCIFFSESDAQKKREKAQVISEKLKRFDDKNNIKYRSKRIQDLPEDFILSFDLVFGCLDNIKARLHVNAFCYYNKIPYIDGATEGFSGKVQVIVSPKTPCLECNLNRTHMAILEKRYSCSGSEPTFYEEELPQDITTTSIIAAIQVREGIKIVSKNENVLTNRILYYNGTKNITEEIEIEINPHCQHHNFV